MWKSFWLCTPLSFDLNSRQGIIGSVIFLQVSDTELPRGAMVIG
jgi:hypothetical protein